MYENPYIRPGISGTIHMARSFTTNTKCSKARKVASLAMISWVREKRKREVKRRGVHERKRSMTKIKDTKARLLFQRI